MKTTDELLKEAPARPYAFADSREIDESMFVYGTDNRILLNLSAEDSSKLTDEERIALGELIVRAVNSFAAMRAAIERVKNAIHWGTTAERMSEDEMVEVLKDALDIAEGLVRT